VLFIGTQFSILYTSMYSPAEAARHYEPFCVLLTFPCTLWQPVQQKAATSAVLLQWPAFALW
jgi:hypothetical protein